MVGAMRDALLEFDPQREAGQKFLGSVERLTGFADVGDKVSIGSAMPSMQNGRRRLAGGD